VENGLIGKRKDEKNYVINYLPPSMSGRQLKEIEKKLKNLM